MKQRDKEIAIEILSGAKREEAARKHGVTPARAGQIFTAAIHAAAPEIAKTMADAAGGKKNGPTCFISLARARAEELTGFVHNAKLRGADC